MLKRKILKLTFLAFFALSSTVFAKGKSRALFNKSNITTIDKLTGDKSHVSLEKKPLILFPIKNPKSKASKTKYRFFIQGGLHGNERLTASFVVWLANKFLKGDSLLNKIDPDIAIDFLSVANPDGLKRNYRYNARAVNLNRNFPVIWGLTKENPGSKPLSEPETRAIAALFSKRDYTTAIDVHGYINWIVIPSTAKAVNSKDLVKNAIYRKWTKEVNAAMSTLGNYQLKSAAALGDGGAFEDWAFWQKGIFSVCLEMANATRFSEINTQVFAKGTDTFERYEVFIDQILRRSIKLKNSQSFKLSEKNLGSTNEAGSNSGVKYLKPEATLDILD